MRRVVAKQRERGDVNDRYIRPLRKKTNFDEI